MSKITYSYTPTTTSISNKNTKYALASAIVDIFKIIESCKDETFKCKLISIIIRNL